MATTHDRGIGIGKSSLALAGVAATLLKTEQWDYFSFRVYETTSTDEAIPFYALVKKMFPLHSPDSHGADKETQKKYMANALKAGDISLAGCIETILENNGGKSLLIVIDQFEELFTSEIPEEDRKAFLDMLIETNEKLAVSSQRGLVHACILITIRSDFQPQVDPYSNFANLVNGDDNHKIISSIAHKDQISEIVNKPLVNTPVAFEEGLSFRIIDDVVRATGHASHRNIIPLLQYALSELWNQKKGLTITSRSYDEMGGLLGALPRKASNYFNSLNSEEDQKVVKDIFLRLVGWVDTSDNGVFTKKLVKKNIFDDAEKIIIEMLAAKENRLLTLSSNYNNLQEEEAFNDSHDVEVTVEISHDSLLSEWKELNSWLLEEPGFIQWRNQLSQSLTNWEKYDKDNIYLLQDLYIEEAKKWIDKRTISGYEKEYIEKSDDHQKQKKRNNFYFRFGVVCTVFFVSLLSLKIYFDGEIEKREQKISFTNKLISQNTMFLLEKSKQLLDEGMYRLAALVSLEILDRNKKSLATDEQAKSAIDALKELQGNYMEMKNYRFDSPIVNYDFSEDSRYLVALNENNDIYVADLDERLWLKKNLETRNIKDLMFRPDGVLSPTILIKSIVVFYKIRIKKPLRRNRLSGSKTHVLHRRPS
ncbi:hypothetical protein [Thalassolituus sp.]|uniref:nSTAND1 domain-containing NTPase n=1 Tax=Thalassolituus sp. TaxID=2030822 RepID=UPI0032D8FD0F